MPYNPNIPQPNDILSVSQGDILANFQELNNFINVSFFPINTAQEGINKWVILDAQNRPALPAVTATQVLLAAGVSALGDGEGFGTLQILANNIFVDDALAFQAADPGFSFIPNGILLKWGTVDVAGGVENVLFPVGANIPPFITAQSVFITMQAVGDPNTYVYVVTGTLVSLGFTVNSIQRTAVGVPVASTFTYLAIGT